MSKCHEKSSLPTPFGTFFAKHDQCFSVLGTNAQCLKFKNGCAINLKLDKCKRAIIAQSNYDAKQAFVYLGFSINVTVESGTGDVVFYRDGVSVGSFPITVPGQQILGTDFSIVRPIAAGTKFALCFTSDSATVPLKIKVKEAVVGIST